MVSRRGGHDNLSGLPGRSGLDWVSGKVQGRDNDGCDVDHVTQQIRISLLKHYGTVAYRGVINPGANSISWMHALAELLDSNTLLKSLSKRIIFFIGCPPLIWMSHDARSSSAAGHHVSARH